MGGGSSSEEYFNTFSTIKRCVSREDFIIMKVRLDSSICSHTIELGDLIINDNSTYILVNTDPITLMDLNECNIS